MGVDCQNCKGSGKKSKRKQPKDYITGDATVYFNLYVYLKKYQIWPNNGGLAKQNSKFLKAIDYIDRILIKLNEIDAEAEKAKRELGAKQGGR